MEANDLTPEPLTVTVTAEKIFDTEEGGGNLYMTIADCVATAHNPETDQVLGRIGGTIGGALMFEKHMPDGGMKIWAVGPDQLWRVFNAALEDSTNV